MTAATTRARARAHRAKLTGATVAPSLMRTPVQLAPLIPLLSPLEHGEPASDRPGGESWAVGMRGQAVVSVDRDGVLRACGMAIGRTAPPPEMPEDDDLVGWDRWAEAVRVSAAGRQQTMDLSA